VRLSPAELASIFYSPPQTKKEVFVKELRHQPITTEPIYFLGDSQLEGFCDCEQLSTSQSGFFRGGCRADMALEHLSEAATASIVVLHIGSGDLLADPSGRQLLAGYSQILDRLVENRMVVVLLPEAMNEGEAQNSFLFSLTNETLARSRGQLTALCRKYPNVRTIDFTPHIVDENGNVDAKLLADPVHYTATGYDKLWQLLALEVTKRRHH
jgi:hypothetical protein